MYRALRAFIYKNKRIKAGDVIPKDIAKNLNQSLYYETKEEKRVYDNTAKAVIEHDAGNCFYIKKGHQVLDRYCGKKSEAQAIADKYNNENIK